MNAIGDIILFLLFIIMQIMISLASNGQYGVNSMILNILIYGIVQILAVLHDIKKEIANQRKM